MYACIYVFTYVYIYIGHICIYIYIYISIYIYIYIYAYMYYIYVDICKYIYTCMHACMHASIHPSIVAQRQRVDRQNLPPLRIKTQRSQVLQPTRRADPLARPRPRACLGHCLGQTHRACLHSCVRAGVLAGASLVAVAREEDRCCASHRVPQRFVRGLGACVHVCE